MERGPQKTFERRESKFVVPQDQCVSFTSSLATLIGTIGLEEEHYRFNINRTVYFIPQNGKFSGGSSIRYRDYAGGPLDQVDIYSGTEGSLEIKCQGDAGSAKEKRKLKIPLSFHPSFTIADLRQLLEKADIPNKKRAWFLERLDAQQLDDDCLIVPIAAVSYQRRRFHKGDNVFNVDSAMEYFKVSENSDRITFTKTGNHSGLVCELKEEVDDVPMRWQVYRRLVKNRATRAKSKKKIHSFQLKKQPLIT